MNNNNQNELKNYFISKQLSPRPYEEKHQKAIKNMLTPQYLRNTNYFNLYDEKKTIKFKNYPTNLRSKYQNIYQKPHITEKGKRPSTVNLNEQFYTQESSEIFLTQKDSNFNQYFNGNRLFSPFSKFLNKSQNQPIILKKKLFKKQRQNHYIQSIQKEQENNLLSFQNYSYRHHRLFSIQQQMLNQRKKMSFPLNKAYQYQEKNQNYDKMLNLRKQKQVNLFNGFEFCFSIFNEMKISNSQKQYNKNLIPRQIIKKNWNTNQKQLDFNDIPNLDLMFKQKIKKKINIIQ